MTPYLYFSSNYYKNITKHKVTANYENNNTAADAFLLCIKSLPYEELDNLCSKIESYYRYKENPISISLEDCYKLTQGMDTKDIKCDKDFKNILLRLAYECANQDITIGSKQRANGAGSTTTWISHCLYQGEAAATLAKSLGLDPDTARKLGILHDIGRKYTHKFMHTIMGFETLIDEGWTEEAFICLSHSFLGNEIDENKFMGIRCCGCDSAIPGFYVDENGKPCWDENYQKDDMTLFLDNYIYNKYDLISNIADLMALSIGVTTPYDRVADIATRTAPDPINRNYFKAEFSNLMIHFLKQAKEVDKNIKKVKASRTSTDEQIDNIFYNVSALFTNYYNKISNNKIETSNVKGK